MKRAFVVALTVILAAQVAGAAQAPATKSVLGTVTSFNKDTAALEVKPDNAGAVSVKLLPRVVVQRIAPGETNLANAVAITPSDISAGDRVLVTLASNGTDVLRIVVIAAGDIVKRDEADRQDWTRRGISGIVSEKSAKQILLRLRTPRGDVQQTIAISENTKFRRYSPDSVRFADAMSSKLEEVTIGDQIRARGEKSSDGLRVDAEEVVFGTFLTKAGTVVSVDTARREITAKELGNGKPFTIRLVPDSAIKRMPDAGGQAAPPGGNIAQIVEKLGSGKLEDVRAGTSVVVSSTKGSEADKVTAILIVVDADQLIRLATTPSGRGGTLVFGAGGGGGLSVLGLP